ncbi:BZ3500_MvSof-1268-A1-R1_Chr9g10493 [Microbotryum saponariae]|uniref:BZ3500_MvSof-1268-A1-R1_Chr9g10493 protein n=1 Tax=Microbotryum saponariae TaxID=289078 RepID=A0A2X0N620_9BASI|nr:BZ3501_MvSof-1269-A2-R1_Chr9g10242 [Microbotryum saponariae]SDA00187.1 BZ3500_MvSof-1268-A1-R1_Chr9g10493 [Microbotryum saponariae]
MADVERSPLLGNEAAGTSEDPSSSPSLRGRIEAALSSPKRLNGLEKLLAALAIVLLLTTATFAGLFAGEAVALKKAKDHHHQKHKHHDQGRPTVTSTVTVPAPTSTGVPPPKQPKKNKDVCLTPTCVTVAASVLTALDESVDPCDDFYRFSNGGWLDTHPIPDGQGFFGSAQDIGVRNKRVIMDVLATSESSLKKMDEADQRNIAHLQDFWASCLDEDLHDRQGLDPLMDLVEQAVSAWRGSSASADKIDQDSMFQDEMLKKPKWDEKTKKDRMTASLMYLHSRGVETLFQLFLQGDVAEDPSHLVAWVQQAGLGLPSKDYYKDEDTLQVYEEIIRATLKSIYAVRGETSVNPKELASGVVAWEKEIAKISLNEEDLEDPSKTYNAYNSTALQALFPSISFKDYFAGFTPRPSYPEPVIVTSPMYLENLAKLIKHVDSEVYEAYIIFRIAQVYGDLVGPKQTVRKEINWLSNYLGGIAEGTSSPRGDICLASLLENYGFLIGRYYAQKAFAGDSKEYAEDIIVATIQAFKDRLPELDWLDETTRKRAEEKADAIKHKIGFPTTPDTMDPDSIERYYNLNLPINRTDFFGNVLRSRLAEKRRLWVKLGKQVDHGEWEMIPSEVNAYYSPPANEIAFPAGILQAPYFSKDWPEYMAFGAFGSVAGHELSHAFDQAGRLYNKEGKLVQWWTNETVVRFEGLQQCLLDQYAQYYVQDDKGRKAYVNSKLTNGEDMADAGGISQSFRAWSDRFESKKGEGMNWLLPGVKYTREQLFFIAYAQGWARNIYPSEAVKRVRTDPHSPTNYRGPVGTMMPITVIGPLSNNEEFIEAFQCKAGSRMNNKHKCQVW